MSRTFGFSRRPVIGVTGPDEGGSAAWWFSRFALWRAGARARRITPSRRTGIEELAGLLLGGGADVDPALYGEVPPTLAEAIEEDEGEEEGRSWGRRWRGRLVAVLTLGLRRLFARKRAVVGGDPSRDELETELIRGALAEGKPILGICRGAQLLNVHLGGTLHQDLEAFYEETLQIRTVRPRKRIEIEPGSLLAELLNTAACRVNALHSQAVDHLGEGVRVAAREGSGVIQAIEHTELPFLLGVQWHPEYLPQSRRQRRLFQGLVEAARQARGTGTEGGDRGRSAGESRAAG